jgi:hypothetical protein
MQKEVEQFLRKYGTVTPQTYHKSEWNRIGICFELKSCGVELVKNLFLTVTVREYLLLEVLHEAPGVDDALLTERLPLNASLTVLCLRLKAMAERAFRQYIKDLALESYCFWEDNIRANLEMLLPKEQDGLTSEVEQFHNDLRVLRYLIAAKTDIQNLIDLHNKIAAFDDRLTQMRLSR